MRNLRRIGIGVVAAVAGYVVLLIILGFAMDGCVAEKVRDRMAQSLDAEVTVGDSSVSLLRGHVTLDDIVVERKSGGHVKLTIEHIEVDLAALGWVIFDRDPSHVYARGVDMSLSARGALTLPERPKRPPIKIGGLRAENVKLTAMPTSLLPGLGRMQLEITEATTGPVELRSSIDWLFAVRELRAQAQLPAGVTAGIGYADGKLRASGSVFGTEPVDIPFEMPVPDPGDLEVSKLRLLATHMATALAKAGAKTWLKREVKDRLLNLFD